MLMIRNKPLFKFKKKSLYSQTCLNIYSILYVAPFIKEGFIHILKFIIVLRYIIQNL